MIIWMLHFAVIYIYSSMTWSTFHFHRSHLLLVFWHSFWTPHCIERTTQRKKIGACIGGIDSDHIRQIQEVRSSIPCLSTSTSFSLRCDFSHSSKMLQQFLTSSAYRACFVNSWKGTMVLSINQTLLLSPFSELHYSLGLIKLASTVLTS